MTKCKWLSRKKEDSLFLGTTADFYQPTDSSSPPPIPTRCPLFSYFLLGWAAWRLGWGGDMPLSGHDVTDIHFRWDTFAFVSDPRVSAVLACLLPGCLRRCFASPYSKGRAADRKDLSLGSALFSNWRVILDNNSLSESPLPYPLNGYEIFCLVKALYKLSSPLGM